MQTCRTSVVTRAAIRNVVFATDFSEESAHAVDHLRSLGRAYQAKIFAVHVADLFPLLLSTQPSLLEKALEVKRQAEIRLRDFMLVHGFDRADFEPAILSGEVFEAVNHFADAHAIDLIVLGSRGDLGLNRLFLGSAAEEIFRTARCPVLTVGPKAVSPGKSGRFNELLFATDLSAHSRSALPYLEYLLGQDPSARITVLHVLAEDPHPLEQQIRVPEIEAELRELIAPDLRGQLSGVIVKPGDPEIAITRAAETLGANLLVLGVRYGGAFLRAATHGRASITNTVISRASCPILTIRSNEGLPES